MEELSKMEDEDSPPSRVNSTEAVNLITDGTLIGNTEKKEASSPHNAPQNLTRGSSHLANRHFISSRSLVENHDADSTLSLLFPFDPETGTRNSIASSSQRYVRRSLIEFKRSPFNRSFDVFAVPVRQFTTGKPRRRRLKKGLRLCLTTKSFVTFILLSDGTVPGKGYQLINSF